MHTNIANFAFEKVVAKNADHKVCGTKNDVESVNHYENLALLAEGRRDR